MYKRDKTVSAVRLELDKIETKRHGIYRSSTYTTLLRLCRTKEVFIRERTYAALRVW